MPRTQASLFLCYAFALAASARADLKITVRHTFQGHSTEHTQYIKGGRKRLDYRNSAGHTYGPRIASITDCGAGKVYELNLDAHEYASYSLPKWPTRDELKALAAKYPRPKEPPKATVTIETTNVDTGERKEIFGHTARHVIRTIKHIPHEGAVSQPSEQVIDGWYIDLDTSVPCELHFPSTGHAFVVARVSGDTDTFDVRHSGPGESGFPVKQNSTGRSTAKLPDGTTREFTSLDESEVTELSEALLDPALFEIPAGFKKVEHIDPQPPVPLSVKLALLWQRFKLRLSRVFR